MWQGHGEKQKDVECMLEVETTGLSNSLDVGSKPKEEPRNHIFYGLCQVLPSQ